MSVRVGQRDSKHGGRGGEAGVDMGASEEGVGMSAGDTEKVLVWEVSIARGCLDSFNRMLAVHAIVFSVLVAACFLSFLQGLHSNTGGRSMALLIFSLANSVALYTATAGLLFSIYCTVAAVISLHPVPLPDRFNDQLSLDLLHNLRTYLRRIALPAVSRRCKFLYSTLAVCLVFCMIAHISAGIASIDPADRLMGVTLPAVPGCFVLLFLLQVGVSKLHLELDFDTRFRNLWAAMVPHIIYPCEIRPLDKATAHALDPLPSYLSWIRND